MTKAAIITAAMAANEDAEELTGTSDESDTPRHRGG